MSKTMVGSDLYWVGAVDWNVKNFHGYTYTTKRGTTYNAYLIKDEKIALVDTVHGPFSKEMTERISEIIPPEKIDYIIVNHVETDHSGGLPYIMNLCKNAKLYGTAKCKEGIYKNYYGNWDFNVVKTGDKLSLGKKTLTFLEAPMIHWPDSMFTYMIEDGILLPNDAFGQHYATSKRFNDEVDQSALFEEAKIYFANILTPLGAIIMRKIEEVQKMKLPINLIAPSHGIIWRKDPMQIVEKYISWSKCESKQKVVIVYETMWGSTEKMARKIADGIIEKGIEVKLYDVNQTNRTEIISQMLDAKGFVIGSSTHNNAMLPSIAGFLSFLKDLKMKNKKAFAFGSYGWAGGAVSEIEKIFKESGIEQVLPSLGFKFVPDVNESEKCVDAGKEFADKIT